MSDAGQSGSDLPRKSSGDPSGDVSADSAAGSSTSDDSASTSGASGAGASVSRSASSRDRGDRIGRSGTAAAGPARGTAVDGAAAHGSPADGTAARRAGEQDNADELAETRAAEMGRRRAAQRRSPTGKLRHALKEVLIIGGTALVVSFLIKTFIAQAFWIPSGSMEETLIYGDRVLVSKVQAGPMSIQRGDIAVFRDPGGWLPPMEQPDRGPIMGPIVSTLEFVGLAPATDGNHLIKRVIGVGGDHIVCCDEAGRITVNDHPLDEDYLYPGDAPSRQPFDIVVPEDHFWMMGDHRSNSRDSRANDDGTGAGGAVPADHMVGRALVLVWPLDRWSIFDGARDIFGDVPDAPAGQ